MLGSGDTKMGETGLCSQKLTDDKTIAKSVNFLEKMSLWKIKKNDPSIAIKWVTPRAGLLPFPEFPNGGLHYLDQFIVI